MANEQSKRVGRALEKSGASWAFLTSPETVCYVSGHEVPIETGPLPFAGGPSLAIVGADGSVGLVIVNSEEASARASTADLVRTYEGYSYLYQAPVKDNYVRTVLEMVKELKAGGGVGIEPVNFPASLREALDGTVSRYIDVSEAVSRVRSIKTPDEVDKLRYAAHLTAIGQRATLTLSKSGRRELEVLADVRCAMELVHGRRMPLVNDLLTGVERTAKATGLPTTPRVLQEGDPIIVDLAPRVNGYWGDSCNTLVIGKASQEFLKLYEVVKRAIERAAEVLRPGISAGAFDAEVRGIVKRAGFDYPHHTGHGIGTGVHEFPRLIPQETASLETDMVLMVEPGAYVEGVGGVRLEWMFRVTASGNEVLSPYTHELHPNAAMA